MADFFKKIYSFNAGELAPTLMGRTDFGKYYKGCKKIENMVVMPQGGVRRRPGTQFVAKAKHDNKKARLLPFNYAVNEAYIIEFGDYYLRFYTSGGGVVVDEGEPYEVESPYAAGDVEEIRYVQSHDVLYLVHPDHRPMALSRYAHTDWRIEALDFKNGPFLPENIDEDHLLKLTETIPAWDIGTEYDKDDTVTAGDPAIVWKSLENENTGNDPEEEDSAWWIATTIDPGRILIDASVDKVTFNPEHVGSLWEINMARDDTVQTNSWSTSSSSSGLWVERGWRLTTHGTWSGTLTLEVRYGESTAWLPFRTYSSQDDNNIADTGIEDDGAYYRLNFSRSGGTLKYTLSASDYYYSVVMKITDYIHETRAAATVHTGRPVYDIETDVWSEGSWSEYRGWPRCICFFEQRLLMAGTIHQPQTIWGSRTGDWDNFKAGVNDDEGISFTFASNTRNPVMWLVAHELVLAGTLEGVWRFGATDSVDPLTPTNVQARLQSETGSVRAVQIGEATLFLGRHRQNLYELVYNFEQNAWNAPDMSILARHLTEEHKIIDMAWHESPVRLLWAIREDGTALTFTYQRENEVAAWSRQTTNGKFLSVGIIPGRCGDEAWFLVERKIGNNIRRFVEFLRFPLLPADFAISTLTDWGTISWAYTQCSFSPVYQYTQCDWDETEPREVYSYDSCIWSV